MSRMPMIVAEIGANHMGDMSRAFDLVTAAARSGANAVKFQCWSPGTMVLDKDLMYEGPGPWKGQSLASLYSLCFTPWSWFKPLKAHAEFNGVEFFASAFDRRSIDFLESLGVKRHKIASFELVDLELIRYAAATGKPLILSTGMAQVAEIEDAVDASAGCDGLTLLRCVSGYPAQPSEAGLVLMQDLALLGDSAAYGLSDHTMTDTIAIAATALGASLIEKHFTLSRADFTPDSSFSQEPAEFERMVSRIRETAAACSLEAHWGPQASEKDHTSLRRSLYWSRDLEPGHMISANDLISARPALGLPPKWKPTVVGWLVSKPVKAHSPVFLEDVKDTVYLA